MRCPHCPGWLRFYASFCTVTAYRCVACRRFVRQLAAA
jgi:hypothetical protein